MMQTSLVTLQMAAIVTVSAWCCYELTILGNCSQTPPAGLFVFVCFAQESFCSSVRYTEKYTDKNAAKLNQATRRHHSLIALEEIYDSGT